jgi:hypothetical protein
MCVVLSFGLRRNSYTPAGRVKEVQLGASHGVNGFSQAFRSRDVALVALGTGKVQEYHSIFVFCYIG